MPKTTNSRREIPALRPGSRLPHPSWSRITAQTSPPRQLTAEEFWDRLGE